MNSIKQKDCLEDRIVTMNSFPGNVAILFMQLINLIFFLVATSFTMTELLDT